MIKLIGCYTPGRKDNSSRDQTRRLKGHCGVHDCVSMCVCVCELICGCLSTVWRLAVPRLGNAAGCHRWHGDTSARRLLIPFEPAQALTWDHMFRESTSALLCYVKGERDENILPTPSSSSPPPTPQPEQSDQSSSHPVSINERSPNGEEEEEEEEKQTLALTAQSAPLSPGEKEEK